MFPTEFVFYINILETLNSKNEAAPAKFTKNNVSRIGLDLQWTDVQR